MKLRKILILSLGMALCAAGAIGAAVAFDQTPVSIANQTAETDKAIHLYWGSGESSVEISNVTNLDSDAQFRYLDVSPKSTKTVTGTVTLTFTLAAYGADGVTTGLDVAVYEVSKAQQDDVTIAATVAGLTPVAELDSSSLSDTVEIAIASSSEAHVTAKYYAIKMSYDGSNPGEGKSMSARLTISQAFAA